MKIREVLAKGILSKSKIFDYVVNPYTGCQHACTYCYARFMKKYTGHSEPWGQFVDVKINAPDLLEKEIKKKKPGKVWVSGVCDPYQPLERKYRLTRRCLEILVRNNWSVRVQTRSPLVLRDMDILKEATDLEVGFSVTTADDSVRKMFEPYAPSIASRIRALEELHKAGIKTHAMIAPLLPGAEGLPGLLKDKVDYIMIDRMNYYYGSWVYKKYRMEEKSSNEYFLRAGDEISASCRRLNLDCRLLF